MEKFIDGEYEFYDGNVEIKYEKVEL
jgi:hypothetical protein